MTNDWIIDVLTDLQRFSANNALSRLADHLDDTIMVAATELSSARPRGAMVGEFEQARELTDPTQPGNTA